MNGYNMKKLIEKFPEELEILELLFGVSDVRDNLQRIEEIFGRTESFWKDRLSLIPNQKVNFLLIGEAPPWTKSGNINYIYNPETKPSIFLQAICKAFFKELIYEKVGIQETLTMLGDKGFLLCDSIPFAMNYSEKQKRNSPLYRKLVKMTSKSYLKNKLANSGINWANNLKVALCCL